jgi:23S rRNA (cytidine1920-2'-O)/16S rRNA (cytidine1409-2'-O)-methyltransferase
MTRARLDQELVRRRLFATRSRARNAVRDGFVKVEGETVRRPAMQVSPEVLIEVVADAGDYVGRGAYKLAGALTEFDIPVEGRSAIDVGSSTGGFTQVWLEAGAESVVALDVGRDQLHPKLRKDPRVEVVEGTNVRDVTAQELGGPFELVSADLSFISLKAVAADIEGLGGPDADWVVLVKPQFEVGSEGLGKDGVVRSAERRGQAVVDVVAGFAAEGLVARGVMRSPVMGGSGNLEAMLWLRRDGDGILSADAFKVLADE